MIALKPLKIESIPSALQKAERYRLLNEPREAESIYLDILQAEPDNQEALANMILALTDKFKTELNPAFNYALSLLDQIHDEHMETYYRGVIYERRAKAHLGKNERNSENLAYDYCKKAMVEYEKVLEVDPAGHSDATLRWNTCARILNENPQLKAREESREIELTDAYE